MVSRFLPLILLPLFVVFIYGAWDQFPALSGDGRTLVHEANWIVYNNTQALAR